MGIETNFGTYLGKMDIISSLATLSYDKRRSEFFSKELITALRLIDNKKLIYNDTPQTWEFYDLLSDSSEQNNLYAESSDEIDLMKSLKISKINSINILVRNQENR